jgi:nitronate monooxygenase
MEGGANDPGGILSSLRRPVVQAPMGGGPSTPRLAAAVAAAGGLGFLAASYKSAAALAEEVAATRELTAAFGVNVFVPGPAADPGALAPHLASLEPEARRYGVEVGEARYGDDDWEAKLELLLRDPVPVVSFTFGCPSPTVLAALREAGSECWVTVTTPEEAAAAAAAGADALIAQGAEAGAHQGAFEDEAPGDPLGLLSLLQLLGVEVELPLVASGGIATGAGLAAVLAAGARAAQVGTAFMLCPEAGTSEPHRAALGAGGPTRITRAFTGRRARGIVNRFLEEHDAAPSAYPELHYATAPIRAAARAAGDPQGLNLWAGQAHALAREEPAADVVLRLDAEAREALDEARDALS